MPVRDPLLTILDTLVYETDQALDGGEVGAARELLALSKVVLVAFEPSSVGIHSIQAAATGLMEQWPELAHVLGELLDLVEEMGEETRYCHGSEPCDACQEGHPCPIPGCETFIEHGDPDGPW